jgi:hypothetical protein
MSTHYFSGVDRPEFARILSKKKACGMINRFRLTESIVQVCRQSKDSRWFIDSGAFTVSALSMQQIESYAEMIIQYGDLFEVYANCDKIGDQEQSNKNYVYLLSLLPVELHHKVLWIYQYGSDIRYLQDALVLHRRIGVGGLVPLLHENYDRAMILIKELALMIAQADVEPHYFGIGGLDIIKQLKRIHPSFSVDNTTWIAAASNGACINREGKRIPSSDLSSIFGLSFDVDERLAQNVKIMKAWMDEPENSDTQKRRKSAQLQMSLDLFQPAIKGEDHDDHAEVSA